jgi:hypothetical protein
MSQDDLAQDLENYQVHRRIQLDTTGLPVVSNLVPVKRIIGEVVASFIPPSGEGVVTPPEQRPI